MKKSNQTVLITGADGFIGSHLTEFLVKKNYKVKVMCVYNSFNTWGWLDSIEKDLLEDVEVISPTSPLGEALIGARIGETVTYEAPGGTLEVEIVSID